jgi:peptide/histidine transporter 3/4
MKNCSFLPYSAVGVGAVQANMAIFGAEQIREQRSTTQYFDKYYAAVNTGGLVSFAILAYVHQNIKWLYGHIIATSLLALTWLIFLMGYKCYIHIKPHDSVITNFFPVLINAFRTWRKFRYRARRIHYERRDSNNRTETREQNDHVSYELNERPKSFFDYAKVAYNGKFQDRVVDDIKALRRVIIMFLLLIPYWIIYLQVQ